MSIIKKISFLEPQAKEQIVQKIFIKILTKNKMNDIITLVKEQNVRKGELNAIKKIKRKNKINTRTSF